MFTGLIEEIGKIRSARYEQDNLILEVSALLLSSRIAVGDSVNINGACQTAVAVASDYFLVNTVRESLRKTNLGALKIGDPVNLELALRADSRLGGHLVSGHVDCPGYIKALRQIAGSWEIEVGYPEEYGNLVVAKGSIALNGISLTVTAAESGQFGISIIPHTWQKTNLSFLRPGDTVNLEFDLIGKYIQQMINPYKAREGNLSLETFRRAGF